MSDAKETAQEEKPAGEEVAAAEGKKFSAKKIIMIVLPILLLAGGGAAAYFMGFIGHHPPDCATVKEGDEGFEECQAQTAAADSMAPGTFIDVPDMIVNLSGTARQPRFLKIRLKVEVETVEDQAKFEVIMPRVVDQFQTYLRELRVEDLRGSSGMYRMKIELLSRVRAAAPDTKVRDVLFQEILIQ